MNEFPFSADDTNPSVQVSEWDDLAQRLAEHENWDQAAAALQQAAEADPFQLWRWLAISRWRKQCGQIAQAIAIISHAINLPEVAPKSTFTAQQLWTAEDEMALWTELAYLYGQDSRWEECERACLEVLERDGDSIQIMELMATACLQTLHLDAAEQLLQNLLQRAPLDPWFRLRYATLLQMQGKSGNAQRELQRLLAMKIPALLQEEVRAHMQHLDELQIQQIAVLLQNTPGLPVTMARDPRKQLEEMGFHVTDPAIETIQNLLWEHFDQSPWLSLDQQNATPRLH